MKRGVAATAVLAACIFAVFFSGVSRAQDSTEGTLSLPKLVPKVLGKDQAAVQDGAGAGTAPAFPGLSEVVPRASELNQKAAQAREALEGYRNVDSFAKRVAASEERVEELHRKISSMGDPLGWNIYQLLDKQKLILAAQTELKLLMDGVSEQLSGVEAVRKSWEEQQAFWNKWQEHLKNNQAEVPGDVFAHARETIRTIVQASGEAAVPLLALQQRLTRELESIRSLNVPVETALKRVRDETFQRNAPFFFSGEFLEQFNRSTWAELKKGFKESWKLEKSHLVSYGGILFLQGVAVVAVAVILRRRRFAGGEERWHFLLRHPWATGIFTVEILSLLIYTRPTVMWRMASAMVLAYSTTFLISGLTASRLKKRVVFFLAVIATVYSCLKLLYFPQPLFRAAQVVIGILSIVFFLRQARLHSAQQEIEGHLFSIALRAGAVFVGAAVIVQIAGFSNLADYMMHALLSTVFMGIVATLLLQLGNGGVELLLTRPFFSRHHFFRVFGRELEARLKRLMGIAVWGATLLGLFQIWGVYASFGQAWEKIVDFQFSFGDLKLSLGLILQAALLLYLTFSISWFLRAFLEAEVFPRRQMERGFGEAVKRLCHYVIVFIGFMIALGVVGIDLTNLAVMTGALGIGIGFGLQNIVNNFVSGLMLLFERPFEVGDVVVIGQDMGTVRSIGLRSTVIQTVDRADLIVPNSQFISGMVTNWTHSDRVARIRIPVGVAYGSDVAKVLGLLKKIGESEPRVIKDPAPTALFLGFGESALDFELHVWVSNVREQLMVRSSLCQAIVERLGEAGVELPSPQRELHVRSIDETILEKLRQPPKACPQGSSFSGGKSETRSSKSETTSNGQG